MKHFLESPHVKTLLNGGRAAARNAAAAAAAATGKCIESIQQADMQCVSAFMETLLSSGRAAVRDAAAAAAAAAAATGKCINRFRCSAFLHLRRHC